MPCSPCPCIDLQKGVKILAILNIIYFCAIIVWSVIGSIQVFSNLYSQEEHHPATTFIIVFTVLFFLIDLLQLGLAFLLYTGASKRSYKRCLVWLIFTVIFLFVPILYFFHGIDFIKTLVFVIYTIYAIIVVAFFLKELKAENGSHTQIE